MCDGCKWSIKPNPAADPKRIQAGVPFWIEEGEPCQECVEREFHKLYNSCPDGRCNGPRDCPKHAEMWERPDDWPTSYPKPSNVDDPTAITPYHRGDDEAVRQRMQREAEAKAEQARLSDPAYWRALSDRLSEALDIDDDGEITDASIAALAHRIEQRRIEEWGDTDSAVGEPLSLVMDIL